MLSLVSTQAATSTLPRCAPDLGFGYVNGEFWYCSTFIKFHETPTSNYAQAGKNACESDLQHDVSWFATEWVDIVLLTDPDLKEFSYDPPDSVVDGTMRAFVHFRPHSRYVTDFLLPRDPQV